jgi:hypothetical protein
MAPWEKEVRFNQGVKRARALRDTPWVVRRWKRRCLYLAIYAGAVTSVLLRIWLSC